MTEYLSFLYDIMMEPRYLQSDYIREHMLMAAEAASRTHITSLVGGEACNKWFIGDAGVALLRKEGWL